ncbi:flippase-like domain-containing protein [Halomarina oriensis]|uniref:Flippase-like domain-containing protein n=1 Tax=Halomarina oriensis TaxID=671145 RepID=A0A6B0GF55_9EURY|nr:flippase-like domain-containing protein [Halomarina oriensis]
MVDARLKRVAGFALRYGIGLLAVAWLLGQLDYDRLLGVLTDVPPETVGLLLVVTAVGLAGRFSTWHVLMNRLDTATFRQAASTDLVVNFINQVLPSRLSGRAAAPVVVSTETGMSGGDSVAVAGVHTGLYAVLYGVVSAVGVLAGVGRFPAGVLLLLGLSTLLYFVAGAFVLLVGSNLTAVDRFVASLAGLFERVPRVGPRLAGTVRSLPDFTDSSAAAFRTLSTSPRAVGLYALGWVVAMVLTPGLRVWLLLDALGAGFEPALLLPLYLLAAYSVTLLPLTPGGIGVTEATATAVFVALGVPAEIVVPVVFLDRFLSVYLPALVGWYPSLRLDLSALAADQGE